MHSTEHMGEVTGIDLWVTGPRNYPHGHVKLPASVVGDLATLLAHARELNPAVDLHVLIRGLWRLGAAALRRNHRKRIPLTPANFG